MQETYTLKCFKHILAVHIVKYKHFEVYIYPLISDKNHLSFSMYMSYWYYYMYLKQLFYFHFSYGTFFQGVISYTLRINVVDPRSSYLCPLVIKLLLHCTLQHYLFYSIFLKFQVHASQIEIKIQCRLFSFSFTLLK